ncbi:MAG: hypothetical protein FD180_2272, partial [Planctomycetota bacterium]
MTASNDTGKAARYLLGDEIARGGLGRIVEAFDKDLDRDVAIKLVIDEGAPDLAARFAREAEITARLDHPNIVPVHDFGEITGADGKRQLFLCMKRIRGRDLSSLIADLGRGDDAMRQKWTRARLLGVFQDVCHGIAYAHSRGIIHRDLKPANVMIGEFGEVLIVDWGLAKIIGDPNPRKVWRSGQTRITLLSGLAAGAAPEAAKSKPARPHAATPDLTYAGEVLGTPAFMSPEQAEGRLEDLDARSDVYSLGAIIYTILTFRPPFAGDNLAVLIGQVARGAVPRPSEIAEIPAALEAVVMRAMAPRREDRYPSAMDLHRDVQLFLEGVRERERARLEAQSRCAEGKRAFDRAHALDKRISEEDRRVEDMRASIPRYAPVAVKKPLWAAELALKKLRDERIAALAEADARFGQALSVDGDLAEALSGRSELHAGRYLEAEAAKDAQGMALARIALEQWDRSGKSRARLEARGRLSVRAFAFECDCLRPVKGFTAEFGREPGVAWRDGEPRPGLAPGDSDRLVPQLRTG